MRLNEIQIQNIQTEYLRLIDKMFELENKRNEIEQEKNIVSHLLERYYWMNVTVLKCSFLLRKMKLYLKISVV
jgi:hypothetical protein